MKHKILIADDSLTIQKVIKITLANEPFELFECLSVENLKQSLNENKPNIVLLDFNLSEDKTGYDLAREIRQSIPNVKILMLYGTFDTVDEDLLNDCGVGHKIVKPFDGTKFINLCRVMADEFDMEDAQSITSAKEDFSTEDFPEPIKQVKEEVIEEQEDEQWVVEGSQQFDDEEEIIEEELSAEDESFANPLEVNMKDWGMDVPGIIGSTRPNAISSIPDIIGDFPGTISEEVSWEVETKPVAKTVEKKDLKEETTYPKQDDLAYPDESDLAFPDESDLAFPDMSQDIPLEIETKADRKKPALVPIENFEEEDDLEISAGGTDTEEALSALKAEIEDELEDKIEASDDLWGADVVVKDETKVNPVVEEEDLPHVESHQLNKVVDNTEDDYSFDEEDSFEDIQHPHQSTPDDFPSDVMDEEPVHSQKSEGFKKAEFPDVSSLEAQLKDKLTPIVEQFVRDYCRQNVEKIAWEVIPDLAENLIKKEIQRISDSILDQ